MPKKPENIKRPWVAERAAFSRSKDNSKFYNSYKWRKTSKAYRLKNPLCECLECKRDSKVKPAEVVNHKKGLNYLIENNIDPFNWDELESMAADCHNRFSGMQRHGTDKGYGG